MRAQADEATAFAGGSSARGAAGFAGLVPAVPERGLIYQCFTKLPNEIHS